MAEALVGGAFLSATLNVLFDRLASPEFISFFSKRKFNDGLRVKLYRTLLALQAVLDDAEDKQITNKNVKAWLDELQHVVHRAEDLLDEIATKALRKKLEAERVQSQTQGSPTQVCFSRFFGPIKQSLLCNNHSVSSSVCLSDEEIRSRLDEVISELESFVEQKKSLSLTENAGRKQSERQETTSLVVESDIYGRDNDKEKIIELLLSDSITTNQIHVIPIVGMGGMGKTTLAQLVYNDAEVNEKFHMKSWVSVSDAFDSYRITKKILDDVTASNNDIRSLDQLQIKLKGSLAGKKFLIVLDDVWNHSYNDWDFLRRPFRAGAQESRIIVTTCIDEVASAMGTVPGHHLAQLSFEDCWSLFANHAFGSGDCIAHPDLESIGKQIVKKCKGLPLALKSLGGLLRSKLDIEDWENILQSEIWDLESDISPALRLSYHYLPSHLKRCFAHCSKFPKDHKFEKEKLVRLWIAEDLVQQPKSNKLVENEGNYYFRELLSRSFFQRLSDSNSYFVMHDLIHDLAQHISQKFCLRLDDDKPLDHICEKVRDFSYIQGEHDAFEKFKVVNEVKHIRSFIALSKGDQYSYLSYRVLSDVLPSLRCLRVLSLSRYLFYDLPESIGNLIHLRYLDLSHTRIKMLPDSVANLYNLQTLDLSYCEHLLLLPMNMGQLIHLRHLDISGTRLIKMPAQMSRLKYLQHLTYFLVGNSGGSRISELKELCQLRGQLRILGLENVICGRDASKANLMGKKHVEVLELEWDSDTSDSEKQKEVLHQLQPHAVVKDLSIINYGGTSFPDWLTSAYSFDNMVSLKLIRCANCYLLPSIGQLPSLKHLRIEGMTQIMEVGYEFYGDASSSSMKPFQFLETLNFHRMPEWKEWHALGAGEFSCLLEFSLVDCPKLTGELPNHLPCLRKLTISGCQQLLSDQVAMLLPRLSSLQKMEMSGMPNLKILPPELCGLLNLESLEINECECLESALEMGLPPMLMTLKIKRCEALKSLTVAAPSSKGMNMNMMGINNIGLKELHISDCSSLLQLSFPIMKSGLPPPPPTLKSLEIYSCRSLEFPLLSEEEQNYHMTCSTEHLKVRNCDLLQSLSLGFFPKLRSLEIRQCINFETLLISDELQNLRELTLQDCPKVESFAHGDGVLPAPNLISFTVWNCENLKCLPQRMHTLLPSLQGLNIRSCPEVESFPVGGLPSNLRTLEIYECKKLLKGRMGWGLQTLPSLEHFKITGGEYEEVVLESFPEEWLLPATVTDLGIINLPNLKSLNHKGLQQLTSLTVLIINNCPKLQSLPEEGLPNSISFLGIWNCPLLEQRCKREEGEDWPKISRICHIMTGYQDIVNLE